MAGETVAPEKDGGNRERGKERLRGERKDAHAEFRRSCPLGRRTLAIRRRRLRLGEFEALAGVAGLGGKLGHRGARSLGSGRADEGTELAVSGVVAEGFG